MLVNCLDSQHRMIRDSFVINKHAQLALAMHTARQIELDCNSIEYAVQNRSELIHLLNRLQSIIPSSTI